MSKITINDVHALNFQSSINRLLTDESGLLGENDELGGTEGVFEN